MVCSKPVLDSVIPEGLKNVYRPARRILDHLEVALLSNPNGPHASHSPSRLLSPVSDTKIVCYGLFSFVFTPKEALKTYYLVQLRLHEAMSALEDLIEGLFHVGVLSVSQQVGQQAQKSLLKASEEKNWLGMLFSAIIFGGSMYAFQSSARDLNRLVRKHRVTLPVYDLQEDKVGKKPIWYLPK